jgi:hypothetical protein
LVEVFLPDLDSWVSFSEIGKEGLNEHSFLKEFEGQ